MSRPHDAGVTLPGCAAMLMLSGCGVPQFPDQPASQSAAATCLPGERGFLQARLRGALEAQPDWRGADLQCEGGMRPDGNGIRLSIAGPLDHRGGQRLRLVFGLDVRPGQNARGAIPTNVTMIVENENQVYATLGDDKCSVDAVVQQPLPLAHPPGLQVYRVALRGYCIEAATALNGSGTVYLDRFDLAAVASYETGALDAAHRK